MKYAKIENDQLLVKEVEKGQEVSGKLTEEEIIAQGYKPLCEVEKPDGAEGFVYKDYGTCYVQIWKMPGEDIRPDEIWTSDSGIMPEFSDLQRLQRDIATVKANINSLSLTSNEALEVKEFYPEWSADSVEVKKGEKYQCDDLLWECIKDHTTQANWKPSLETASIWKVVEEEHEGTEADPIPYTPPMELFLDKYYTQSDALYKCTKNSEIPLSQNLSELVGLYVELVK